MRVSSFILIPGWAVLLTLPVASWFLVPGAINLSLPNAFALLFISLLPVYLSLTSGIPKALTTSVVGVFAILVVWVLCAPLASARSLPDALGGTSAFQGAVAMFPIGVLLGSMDRHRRWEAVLLFSVLVSAGVGVGHYFGVVPQFAFEKTATRGRSLGEIEFVAGYTGLIGGRGDYGIWCVAGLAVARFWFLRYGHSWLRRLLLVGSVMLILCAVLLSISRSSWLAVLVFGLVSITGAFVVHGQTMWKRGERLIWAGILVLSLGVLFVNTEFAIKIFRALEAMNTRSVVGRLGGFQLALDLVAERPLFGFGPQVREASAARFFDKMIHNSFLDTMARYGILAGLLLILCVGMAGWRCIRSAFARVDTHVRMRAVIWLAALLAWVCELSLYSGVTSKYFWILFGILCGEMFGAPGFGRASVRAGPTHHDAHGFSRQPIGRAPA